MGVIWFYKWRNKRRDVVSEVQLTLALVGITSGNVVHSNIVHTMDISRTNKILGWPGFLVHFCTDYSNYPFRIMFSSIVGHTKSCEY